MYIKRGFLILAMAILPISPTVAQGERFIDVTETASENGEAIDITTLDNQELVLTRSGNTVTAHHRQVDGTYEDLPVGPTLPNYLDSRSSYSLFCADPVFVINCQMYEVGTGLVNLADIFDLLSFSPTAISSSGLVVGLASNFDPISGQIVGIGGTVCLDLQSGSVDDCNTAFLAGQVPSTWAVLGISEDGTVLAGEFLDFDTGESRPFFLDRSSGSNGFLGFGGSGLATAVGSSPFGQHTVLFQDNGNLGIASISNGSVQSQFLVQEAVEFHGIGSSGVAIRTGDGGCAIVSPDGNGGIITSNSLGTNCVGATQVGNFVSYLDSGSAIVHRTLEGSPNDSGGAGMFEAVTLSILACLNMRKAVRCSNLAARDAGFTGAFARAIRDASKNLSDDEIVVLVDRISQWQPGFNNRQINQARLNLLSELGHSVRTLRYYMARLIYRNLVG